MSSKSVLSVIENYINLYKENKDCYEVEARYGIKTDKFKPHLPAKAYLYLMNYFTQKLDPTTKCEFIVMHDTQEPFKVIQEVERFDFPWKNTRVLNNSFIKKTTEQKIDLCYYNDIRISLAKELEYTPSSEDFKTPIKYMKLRHRTSFAFDKIKVDLSYYKEGRDFSSIEKSHIYYEIEIECSDSSAEIYLELIKEFDFLIYQSLFSIPENYLSFINKDTQEDVITKYKSLFNQKERKMVGLKPITFSTEKFNSNEDYAMTPKLDGERIHVFVYNKTLFLINENMNVAKLGIDIKADKFFLLEGELYQGSIFIYEIFMNENVDLRDKMAYTLVERISMMDSFVNTLIQAPFFRVKPYSFIEKENNICILEKAREMYNNSEFKTDGVVIVPIDRPIYKKINELPCLKWKPAELNTIDFFIKKKEITQNYEIWKLYYSSAEGLKPFHLPFCKIDANFAQNFMDNTVCEFAYNADLNMMTPVKMRLDKEMPNFETTVNDIWGIITQKQKEEKTPIKETTNVNISNISKWLHWVRRNVYCNFLKKAGNVLFLGDIQGDIYKWIDFDIRNGELLVEKDIDEIQGKINVLLEKPMNKSFAYKAFDLKSYRYNPSITSCACFFLNSCNKNELLSKATQSPKIVFITDVDLSNETLLEKFTLETSFSIDKYYPNWETKGFSLTEKEKSICMNYNVYVYTRSR